MANSESGQPAGGCPPGLWCPLARPARPLRTIIQPVAAVVVALACGAALLAFNGYEARAVIDVMVLGVFQDTRSIAEILLKATPLILIGVGLCVAFRCSIWNIGAEGQFYAGAIAATAVGRFLRRLSAWAYVPLVMLAGALAGAAWAADRRTSEGLFPGERDRDDDHAELHRHHHDELSR